MDLSGSDPFLKIMADVNGSWLSNCFVNRHQNPCDDEQPAGRAKHRPHVEEGHQIYCHVTPYIRRVQLSWRATADSALPVAARATSLGQSILPAGLVRDPGERGDYPSGNSAAASRPAMRPKTIGAVVELPPVRPMPWMPPVHSPAA